MATPIGTSVLLRRALLVNAAFSASCALILGSAGHVLAPRMGLPAAWGSTALYITAAGLLVFALGIVRNARRADLHVGEACATTIADLGWVVGTVLLLGAWGAQLTRVGVAVSVGVALMVGLLAVAQAAGLRRISVSGPGAALAQ